MKVLYTVMAAVILTASPITASAQWQRGPAPQPSDGLKDAYKEFLDISV